ncbi:MAG TPA: methyltransferase domain-containing protein [Caldilineaceae bacterium]|nr:methyltransferase domain-containing protein [Caldilineaceae bacterium]
MHNGANPLSDPNHNLADDAAAPWRRYLTDYNEGLGLVYERFVLNDFLDRLCTRYGIGSVLEAPLYGMAGVSGINGVVFARRGIPVTAVDDEPERIQGVQRIWQDDLRLPIDLVQVAPDGWHALPFPSRRFDLAWQWAGLWYLDDPAGLLRELARTSRRLVFVAMPNRLQIGYWTRKLLIDREFFRTHDERWTQIGRIRRILEEAGVRIIEQGVLDVPPWPDTVMPAAEVLKRLGIGSARLTAQFSGDGWRWSTMAHYLGEEPALYDRVMRYAWLDRAPLPWQMKAVWAHHRYLLGEVI